MLHSVTCDGARVAAATGGGSCACPPGGAAAGSAEHLLHALTIREVFWPCKFKGMEYLHWGGFRAGMEGKVGNGGVSGVFADAGTGWRGKIGHGIEGFEMGQACHAGMQVEILL